MSHLQSKNMGADDFAYRLNWLAKAGFLLTIERAQIDSEWLDCAACIQALFETLEGLSADLIEHLEELEMEAAA